MQLGESEHLLLHLRPAVLDDPLHLFVDELDAPEGRIFQPADLTLHEQLERHLRDEKSGPWARCIPDGSQDVQRGKPSQRMDGIQCPSERFVEDVANPRTSAPVGIPKLKLKKNLKEDGQVFLQFRRFDVPGRSFDGGTVRRGKFGDDLKKRLALVLHVIPVRVQKGLELGDHQVDSRLELRQTVPDVMHQEPLESLA